MTVIKVEDMACGKCEERISDALKKAGLDFEVSLMNKTVSVDGCAVCVKTALGILDDLGFEGVVEE